jgi:type III secretory pathway component EscS
MNTKRVLIATVIGALSGIFCAYGTSQLENPAFPITMGLLASVFYNRLLIGIFVGIADNIKLNPVIRGAILGAIVTMAMSIIPIVDGQLSGGLILIGFGVVYGIIADVVATKLS